MLKSTIATVFLLLATPMLGQDGFQNLFNGKDLSGWEQITGKAPYTVENDAIVGTAVLNTPNSFLCTERTYANFILEFEFWVDPPLNTGVMFRCDHRPEGDLRRIFGYQLEIDPSPRAYTGGIYDEARRGWIYPLHYNPPAREAFKQGAWNKARVEAIGHEIRTFINGVPCANLIDNLDDSGLICLQVHSISPGDEENKQVRWRNLRIKENATRADQKEKVNLGPVENLIPNQISEAEKRAGWRLLWDGKTAEGWRGAKLDHFPTKGWSIDNGILTVEKSDGGESTNGGDIVTIDHFSNFELKFEFYPTEGANSGVKYFVDPKLNKGAGSAIGLEFQILDDQRHPDAKKGVNGNRTVGSLYDLIAAKVVDVPSRSKNAYINAWNRGRIVVRGGQVEHWLNGYKMVEYDRFSQMFEALVNYSKYKDWPHFGRWPSGPILLQDHGDKVSFRSIKIREF
ncbi:MAG: DUF1080 domain-containing protein [Bacteroidota bacterium]